MVQPLPAGADSRPVPPEATRVSCASCGNCNAPLTGPYCAQCGQHAHQSARSLSVVLHDGWDLLTHLDGRFWSTLRRLLSQVDRILGINKLQIVTAGVVDAARESLVIGAA